MAASRRVGADNSTRDQILDAVERLMLEGGHSAVSYRAVAAEADVTAGLVQYYFPSRDELFVAAIRRRSEQNVERLHALLDDDCDAPLHALWQFSQTESTAVLTTEFLALGNHLESVRHEIAKATEQARSIQLAAIERVWNERGAPDQLSPAVALFLATSIPRMLRLEEGVGIERPHAEVVRAVEAALDLLEPPTG